MFIQVIQARPKNPQEALTELERWQKELSDGAIGYLGATNGLTEDGELVSVVRFESQEAAMKNSARPEVDRFAKEFAELLESPQSYLDASQVDVFGDGGSDEAGFVQIIQGRSPDRERLRAMDKQFEANMRETRPDIIGGTTAWHDDNRFTSTIYFRSEAEARAGEKQEMPEEQQALMNEYMGLMQDVKYIDLKDPAFHSA